MWLCLQSYWGAVKRLLEKYITFTYFIVWDFRSSKRIVGKRFKPNKHLPSNCLFHHLQLVGKTLGNVDDIGKHLSDKC